MYQQNYKMEISLLAILDKIHPVQGVLSSFGAILKIHHQDAEHYAKNLWEILNLSMLNTWLCKVWVGPILSKQLIQ